MCFEVKKCCFCIELRTGCLIIGYLNLFNYVVVTLMLIFVLAMANVAIANADSKEFQDAKVVMFAVIVTILVFAILFLTFNIVLLVGLHKNKRGHVQAYLIYTRIIIILSIILLFGMFGATDLAENFVIQIVNIFFTIYIYLVIKSYHLKMDNSANNLANA